MRVSLNSFTILLSTALLIAMTGIAEAWPGSAVSTANSCKACHGPSPGTGEIRAGALAVVGQTTLDLGTQLDGSVRGPLQTFTVTAGQTVDLTVNAVDGFEAYAVQLKRLEKGGQLNDVNNSLLAGAGYLPDPLWFPQGSLPATYFTSIDGFVGTPWVSGPVSYTFTLFIDPATPPDVYDLEFAVAGRNSAANNRLKFYEDEHFYVEVLAPANSPPVVDPGGPYTGVIGQPVQFDASNTVDPDGDNLIYLWDFGDGSTPPFPSQDPMASHTYDTAGDYIAQLAVTDGVNLPMLVDVAVTITDAPPPPPGDNWTLISPYVFDPLNLRLEPFAGILMIEITQSSGTSSIAIGMELQQGVIFWMDVTGAIYFGNIDRVAGSMSGVAFGGPGGGGIWFAEQL